MPDIPQYLNKKFTCLLIDKNYAFVEIKGDYELDIIFTTKERRKIVTENMVSYQGYCYIPHDKQGLVVRIQRRTIVEMLHYILTDKIYIRYIGKLYECTVLGRNKRQTQEEINNQKDLVKYLQQLDNKKGSD